MGFWKADPPKEIPTDADKLKTQLCEIERNRLKNKEFEVGDLVKIDHTLFSPKSFAPYQELIFGNRAYGINRYYHMSAPIEAILEVGGIKFAYLRTHQDIKFEKDNEQGEIIDSKNINVKTVPLVKHFKEIYIAIPLLALIGEPKEIVIHCRS